MTQPTPETLLRDVGVLGAEMKAMKESLDEFKDTVKSGLFEMKEQTKLLHSDNKESLNEFKAEVSANSQATREEIRDLERRIRTMENRDSTTGGVVMGLRTILAIVSAGPISAMIIYLLTRS